MTRFDEAYINELLQAVTTCDKEAFYLQCKADICAGYGREVNEAWKRRSKEK